MSFTLSDLNHERESHPNEVTESTEVDGSEKILSDRDHVRTQERDQNWDQIPRARAQGAGAGVARAAAARTAPQPPAQPRPLRCGRLTRARHFKGGNHIQPAPINRDRPGSKHHLIDDVHGIRVTTPLVCEYLPLTDPVRIAVE